MFKKALTQMTGADSSAPVIIFWKYDGLMAGWPTLLGQNKKFVS